MMNTLPVEQVVGFIGALLLFVGILFGLSRVLFTKYELLAGTYALPPGQARPKKWTLVSPDFGGLESSRNGVWLSADSRGIYFQIFIMFRWGRPPLFVPWDHITVAPLRRLGFFQMAQLSFRAVPTVKMALYSWDWKRAQKKFPGPWPKL